MTTRTRRSQRRTEALSRERIVAAAVEVLDATGESGLTFRVLTERLATGPGAIYWHVANKGELLAAATEAVVTAAVAPAVLAAAAPTEPGASAAPGTAAETGTSTGAEGSAPHTAQRATAAPRETIRTVALGLYDAIDTHPWLATQIAVQVSAGPGESVAPLIFETIGRQVRALGAPEPSRFVVTSVLVHYILGAAGQNAANARSAAAGRGRAEFLDSAAATWQRLDPDDYPFLRSVADQMRVHDDREQFLAGIDLVLAGIATLG
ncbi:TetR/AcrR family transcriptional regulator C-terminal domain-containing protein [Nocardia sp. alder85J]|uniref:TetR/AcrR family transcriptional regulator C-terminal domain-containing protein n=1 Tax=Nocardia sp. alder85J TaxID=2862949 RepID=UPI001CD79775|nr:TetR/AcrR family transcriptional regulator C-terminal domain-containing protein [Nocardia sp. alder85J]MCX4091727.1 TetR/AcrR family transcriptional regulator C-terminal domain-containing protein [Nocardia sp. alder85J]